MQLPQLDNYPQLFIDKTPLLDVRAPVEFLQGAFPHTRNLPLMSDEERHLIGIRYKQQGQQAAIELGQELIQSDIRDARIAAWIKFTEQHPQGALYCFRGGLRSKICQQWIYETSGTVYPRIKGGYKALRRFLIDELANATTHIQPVVLGGRTGSGKTLLIQHLKQQIDLEKIFNHRGSAFGKRVNAQPSQIDIENKLAIEFLRQRHQRHQYLLLEDEAANIGSRQIPLNLFNAMQQAPIVLLEIDIDTRIRNVFQEYVTDSLAEFQTVYGEEAGFEQWVAGIMAANEKIQRRLGGQRHKEMSAILFDAIEHHRNDNDTEFYQEWIRRLLSEYYDPMYDYQIEKKQHRIIMRNNDGELLRFLEQHYNII